jgi:signal transduction histidine kinase
MNAPESKPEQRFEFEIDASVVYQLGEQLISSETQALVELVKNSYDADASYANIKVITDESAGDRSRTFPGAKGYILIEDDGTGMGWEEIKRGWLTISASLKRELKARGGTTQKRHRTPLGDKGLGRLGAQRLGRYLEMWTIQEGDNRAYYVGIDWEDFRGKTLSQVPAYIELTDGSNSRGTQLLISGLRGPEAWKGSKQTELVNQLSQLMIPFGDVRPFDLVLSVDGKRIELDSIADSVLAVAGIHITFAFDGKDLSVRIRYRPTYLLATTQGQEVEQQFQTLVASDQGADFFAYLTHAAPHLENLQWADEPGWLAFFAQTYSLDDLGEVKLNRGTNPNISTEKTIAIPSIANPGPFRGEIYAFARRGADLGSVSSVFNRESNFREFIDRHAGIRVFRDGFGIRPFGVDGNDWLNLGKAWTSGGSWYGLRPNNVIGYVALTAKDNRSLEEATDREGFVENGATRNFLLLMGRVIKVVNDTNEELRRNYGDYRKMKAQAVLGPTAQSTEEIFESMRETARASQDLTAEVAETRSRLTKVSSQVKDAHSEFQSTPLLHTEEELRVVPLLTKINGVLGEANAILQQLEVMLAKTKGLGEMADVLEPDIDYLRQELQRFSELAGLGLTAEALSHEMSIIADGLAGRTTSLITRLKNIRAVDPQIFAYTEFVHGTVANLRKQLSHLDPSLRYVREQRDTIGMLRFFDGMQDFYRERFARSSITTVIEAPFNDFEILMNRGKLTQVVDNLLLNSEYWLKEDLRKGNIAEAKVLVRSRKPFVEISDSGRGVAPSIEHLLFQPFVTAKPTGKGRGLGLFIARQLLDSSGCSISLLPNRNSFDRRYIFRIDFTGALA